MRFTFDWTPDSADAATARDWLHHAYGRTVPVTIAGMPPVEGTIVAASVHHSGALSVTVEIPDESLAAQAASGWHRSSALGLPPGLRPSGQPGERALSSPGGLAELLEGDGGQWRDQWSSRSWEGWRNLARLILDTNDPG
jgi:hypothetical protein